MESPFFELIRLTTGNLKEYASITYFFEKCQETTGNLLDFLIFLFLYKDGYSENL